MQFYHLKMVPLDMSRNTLPVMKGTLNILGRGEKDFSKTLVIFPSVIINLRRQLSFYLLCSSALTFGDKLALYL